ncbi:MAG: hypothetical protein CO017_07845 [Zetaproteobacteria bacterium CG_4_8_14_3_um_filter_59_5]|nr:MAG: hypothetical protein CO017_07845 [Zetaproteobacteria bacterium CG_4_8_14_3_um_filter_59_5]
MSITLGFAMRIGDFPPAVLLPPAPPPVHNIPVAIEAQIVPESGALSTRSAVSGGMRFNEMRFGGSQGQQYFRNHANTYTSHGRHGAPVEHSGFNLDLFA